jgi:hypothetical protein
VSEQDERRGLTRRTFLYGAAATTAAGAAGAVGLRPATAQEPTEPDTPASHTPEPDTYDTDFVAGTGGATVPLRAPAGMVDFLDPNQYIHNMEIVAHNPDDGMSASEPQANMWVKGSQRLIATGGGFLDITDPTNPVRFNNGQYSGGFANIVYNEQLKKWILMTSAEAPRTVPSVEFPRGKYHPEYFEQARSFTGFRGIRTWDATDPNNVQMLDEFNTGQSGSGTHMNAYDGGRYAYLECGFDDTLRMENDGRPFSYALMIVDMSDPANVQEVSRWWVPGQRFGEEEEYFKYPFAGDQTSWTGIHGGPLLPRRVEDGGTVGYAGWGHFGMYVHDFSDITQPKVYGKVMHQLEARGSIPYHSVYPIVGRGIPRRLRNLVITNPEPLMPDNREDYHTPYVIDVSDRTSPKIIGLFPRPVPPSEAPYADFALARGRFGTHNSQAWIAPGRVRPEIVAMAHFTAGLRLYDISDPTEPREVAYFVPPREGNLNNYNSWRRGSTETVLIEWDRNLIWLSANGGTYCLSSPALGEPVLEPQPVREWSVPHVNRGHDG